MADKPQLYLFLSVDIIDSTAIKYNTDKPIDWYSVFTDFYVSFPDEFKTHLKTEYGYQKLKYSQDNLVVWKYAGDEILFYAEITQKTEILCIVTAFKKTLEDWYPLPPKGKLDVKGCIWTGQVPFIDRKIEEERSSKFDFIGPSIDCGFRLGKYSSKEELVVSVEVADQINGTTSLQSSLYYLKSENLKGVLGNEKYPIFALKLDGAKHEEFTYLKTPCDEIKFEEYIKKYYANMNGVFKGKVSRIGKDVPAYLKEKESLCESIQVSEIVEQQNAQEIAPSKKDNSKDFKEYTNLLNTT